MLPWSSTQWLVFTSMYPSRGWPVGVLLVDPNGAFRNEGVVRVLPTGIVQNQRNLVAP
jgi:hypothetical protein